MAIDILGDAFKTITGASTDSSQTFYAIKAVGGSVQLDATSVNNDSDDLSNVVWLMVM